MGCPDEMVLWALVEGTLDPISLLDVDAHLDDCATCREVVGVLASGQRVSHGPTLSIGDRVGYFVVRGVLGQGAMGMVFAASDPELERPVALKVLHAGADTEKGRARLVREAKAMAQLNHPCVVTVYEIRVEDDRVYLVMERAEENLREWLSEGRSPAEIHAAFLQAASGLAAAHVAGIVHRDFKPENVLISTEGVAKVADFGLASERELKGTAADASSLALTQTGALLGTPAYMAPERLAGEAATARSDQYSFCVSYWEALEGERPFVGSTVADLRESIAAGPPRARSMSKIVETALRQGLSADPRERHANMNALQRALTPRRFPRWAAFAGVAALGVLAFGSAVALGGFGRSEPDPCDSTAALDASWNAPVREQLSAAFERAGQSVSGRVVAEGLERWAQSWRSERSALCAAHPIAERDAAFAASLRCFRRQSGDVGALVSRLNAETATFGADVLDQLPEPGRCDAVDPQDLPDDATLAAIADGLSNAAARLHTGDASGALDALQAPLESARAAAHAPTIARAELLRAQVLRTLARYDEADEAAQASLFAIEGGQDERAKAEAWLELVAIAGAAGEYERAARHLPHAAAAVGRSDDAELSELLLHRRGVIWTQLGRFEEAKSSLDEALAARSARLGPDALSLAPLYTSMGHLARLESRLADALADHERALALDRTLGERHPWVARDLHNVAGVLRRLGRTDEALANYRLSLDIRREVHGVDHPEVGLGLNSLGLVHFDAGEWALARESWEAALAIFTSNEHADAAMTQHNLALVSLRQERAAEAVEHAAAALRLDEERLGPDAKRVGVELVTMAEALVALERFDEARQRVERAIEIARTVGDPELEREARVVLATARPSPPRPFVVAAREPSARSNPDAESNPVTMDTTMAEPVETADASTMTPTAMNPVRFRGGGSGAYGGGQAWE